MLMKQLTLESSSHTIIQNLIIVKIQPLFDEALPYYEQFIQEVTQFLEKENVPVTAFGKGDNK